MADPSTNLLLTPPPAGPRDTGSVASATLRDARPPVAIPGLWGGLTATLLLLALAAAAYYAWRRYRQERLRPPPAIVIPPYRRALDRLRAALDLIHRPERFCVAVSDATRAYLEERFQWHAPERTTEEFLAEIQTSPLLATSHRALLGDFLTRCDLVKFARYEPAEPELRQLYEAAVRLVEETEPLLNPQATPAPTSAAATPAPAS